MSEQERAILVAFCAYARAYIEGLDTDDDEVADALWAKYGALSDEELQRESDWLDEVSNK